MQETVSEEDKKKCLELMKDIESNLETTTKQYKTLLDSIIQDEPNSKKGHPLLKLIMRELSSYIKNLAVIMASKVQGNPIHESPAVWSLVVSRTVLSKLFEVEKKLKYELEQSANKKTSASAVDNPLNLNPGIENLCSDNEGEDEEEEEKEDGTNDNENKEQIYKPSKRFPKFYDEPSSSDKGQKRLQVRRSVLNDLRAEFTDQPFEYYDGSGVDRLTSRKKEAEKTQYEESHFVRLQTSKKDKMAARRMSSFDDVIGPINSGEKKKNKRKSLRGKRKSKKFKSK